MTLAAAAEGFLVGRLQLMTAEKAKTEKDPNPGMPSFSSFVFPSVNSVEALLRLMTAKMRSVEVTNPYPDMLSFSFGFQSVN